MKKHCSISKINEKLATAFESDAIYLSNERETWEKQLVETLSLTTTLREKQQKI